MPPTVSSLSMSPPSFVPIPQVATFTATNGGIPQTYSPSVGATPPTIEPALPYGAYTPSHPPPNPCDFHPATLYQPPLPPQQRRIGSTSTDDRDSSTSTPSALSEQLEETFKDLTIAECNEAKTIAEPNRLVLTPPQPLQPMLAPFSTTVTSAPPPVFMQGPFLPQSHPVPINQPLAVQVPPQIPPLPHGYVTPPPPPPPMPSDARRVLVPLYNGPPVLMPRLGPHQTETSPHQQPVYVPMGLLPRNHQPQNMYVGPDGSPISITTQMELVWHGQFNMLFSRFAGTLWSLQPLEQGEKPPTGWREFKDSAKVRFLCEDCGHGWTSMKGRVVFWFKFNAVTGSGFVQFRLYGQSCDHCNNEDFQHAMWYPEEVEKVINNVFNRVGQVHFGFQRPPMRIDRRQGKPRNPHNAKLCQACCDGICREEWTFS